MHWNSSVVDGCSDTSLRHCHCNFIINFISLLITVFVRHPTIHFITNANNDSILQRTHNAIAHTIEHTIVHSHSTNNHDGSSSTSFYHYNIITYFICLLITEFSDQPFIYFNTYALDDSILQAIKSAIEYTIGHTLIHWNNKNHADGCSKTSLCYCNFIPNFVSLLITAFISHPIRHVIRNGIDEFILQPINNTIAHTIEHALVHQNSKNHAGRCSITSLCHCHCHRNFITNVVCSLITEFVGHPIAHLIRNAINDSILQPIKKPIEHTTDHTLVHWNSNNNAGRITSLCHCNFITYFISFLTTAFIIHVITNAVNDSILQSISNTDIEHCVLQLISNFICKLLTQPAIRPIRYCVWHAIANALNRYLLHSIPDIINHTINHTVKHAIKHTPRHTITYWIGNSNANPTSSNTHSVQYCNHITVTLTVITPFIIANAIDSSILQPINGLFQVTITDTIR